MKSTSTLSRLRFPALFTGLLAILTTGFYYRKSFMHDLADLRNSLEQENPESKLLLETAKKIARQQTEGIK